MNKVLKENGFPLYYQIKDSILNMIENEQLKPGDAIPPEREICKIQGVSRMTVNKAIMELVNDGILYREQGRGTFVARPKQYKKLSQLIGFSEEMESKGHVTSSKIISFDIKKATHQIKEILDLPEDKEYVITIKRLRLIDNEPIAIETVWLARHRFVDMSVETIFGQSLYKIFREKYGYELSSAKETIEPKILNEFETELLNQPESQLALKFKKIAYIGDQVPIEYTEAIYRSDKYKYEIQIL
ncbi:GntR family transcriptional regulator [Konateibacter massiliensis]|uniref:GntR family transcriptional regulator n=1 Tax=Konateibacter massiliensis TaxID=2002841 RepID=UPI000C14FDB7|nr:GntR family transcriptional regulator [Konateibacter massiliensis]